MNVPEALEPFVQRWTNRMRDELTPLAGKKIDPRFIETVLVKL
jgi:hypothetical protein